MGRKNVISDQWSKLKWVQVMLFAAATAVVIALVILSALSYLQTEIAFRPFNDSTIYLFGFAIGSYISHLFAVVFQYGQNVALGLRAMLKRDTKLFTVLGFDVTDRNLALGFFIMSAIIDAGTNIIWMESVWSPSGNAIRDFIIRLVGWAVMGFSVFFEELIGVVIDFWSYALKKVRDIYYDEARGSSTGFLGSPARPKTSNSPFSGGGGGSMGKKHPKPGFGGFSHSRTPERRSAPRPMPQRFPVGQGMEMERPTFSVDDDEFDIP